MAEPTSSGASSGTKWPARTVRCCCWAHERANARWRSNMTPGTASTNSFGTSDPASHAP